MKEKLTNYISERIELYLPRDFAIKIYLGVIFSFYYLQLNIITELIWKAFFAFGILLGCFIVALYDKKIKNILIFYLFLVLTYFLFDKDTRLISIMLTAYILRNDDISKYIKLIFLASLTSFIFNSIIGFNHLNGCAVHYGICVLLYFVWRSDNILIKEILIIFGMNLVMFFLIDSAQALVCISFASLSLIMYKYRYTSKYIINIMRSKFTLIIVPLIASINYYLPLCLIKNKIALIGDFLPKSINVLFVNIILKLDELMSYRLSLSQVSLGRFGFKLFGKTLNTELITKQGNYFNLDSGYLQILQTKGLLFLIIFIIMSVLIIRYFIIKKDYVMIIVGVTLALWGINEDILLTIAFNFIFIYAGSAINDTLKNNLLFKMKENLHDGL